MLGLALPPLQPESLVFGIIQLVLGCVLALRARFASQMAARFIDRLPERLRSIVAFGLPTREPRRSRTLAIAYFFVGCLLLSSGVFCFAAGLFP